ncbi:MAG: DUF3764 family protein [Bacteroidetes bacterium]|nr:DUF3764 family protein [Bacteroidota bacterium]
MAVIILTHSVEDYDKWKPLYDDDRTRRDEAGLKEVICGQKSDDPKQVYVVWETDNPDSIQAMFDDPELKEKMEQAGVTSPPEITIVK